MDVHATPSHHSPGQQPSPREGVTFFTPEFHMARRVDRQAFLDYYYLLHQTVRAHFAPSAWTGI